MKKQAFQTSLGGLKSYAFNCAFVASILALHAIRGDASLTHAMGVPQVRNQEAAGSIPARSTTTSSLVSVAYEMSPDAADGGLGRAGDGNLQLSRYSGAAVVEVGACRSVVSALSVDDPNRHDPANYYRNRWSYTLTSLSDQPGCITPRGTTLATVRAAIRSARVAMDIGGLRLTLTPAEPALQEQLGRSEGACEENDQLVTISVDDQGRTVVLIEDPGWLPWTRRRC